MAIVEGVTTVPKRFDFNQPVKVTAKDIPFGPFKIEWTGECGPNVSDYERDCSQVPTAEGAIFVKITTPNGSWNAMVSRGKLAVPFAEIKAWKKWARASSMEDWKRRNLTPPKNNPIKFGWPKEI